MKIAFLGAGKMVGAIVRGLHAQGTLPMGNVICYSPSGESAKKLADATGCRAAETVVDLLEEAEVLFLGCKPQHLAGLSEELTALCADKLVVSLLAGKTVATLRKKFPTARAIVRAMPNTPAQIGFGVTTCALESTVGEGEWALCEKVLGAVGKVFRVEEAQMDALTALGGSGPAFIFEFCRSLEEGARSLGIEPRLAHQIAVEMLFGSASLLRKSDKTPAELRTEVTSPNGTTAAGLAVLENNKFTDLIANVLRAATERGAELSKN